MTQCWKLKSFRLHGGDVPEETIVQELPVIRSKVDKYNRKDVFNCDEPALFWQMAPDRTIADCSFPGRKKQKSRFTFMYCCNGDGSENLALFFIGTAESPRCFKKKKPEELGLIYKSNKKAWMTSALFSDWLVDFDAYIGKTPGRHVLLLMDNCSAHGSQDSQPELRNVSILFFPPNTTSRLQPLDAGIIAAIKLRYRRRQMEFAVDMAEVGKGDIYKVDILSAMRWLTDVWNEITADTIFNCWRVTGIMGSDMTTERE